MQYNARLIEYSDTGTATLVLYDTFIGSAGGELKQAEHIEPFTHTTVREKDILTSEEQYYKSQENLQKSVGRSKRNILELMRSVKWEYFITLTFDPKKIDRTDFTVCTKKVRKWLQNQRRNATDLIFICIPELHSDLESWHAHAVLANVGNMQFAESGHTTKKGQPIYNLSGWTWGFSTAIPVDDEPETTIKLAKYITKYLTKESYLVTKNRHRYFASNNIPKARKQRFAYLSAEDKERLVSEVLQQGYKVVWQSRHEGQYIKAEYLEVIKDHATA